MYKNILIVFCLFLLISFKTDNKDYNGIIKIFKNSKACSGLDINRLLDKDIFKTDLDYTLKDSLNHNNYKVLIFSSIDSKDLNYTCCFFKNLDFIDFRIIKIGTIDTNKIMKIYSGDYGSNIENDCFIFYCYNFKPINLDSTKVRPFQDFWRDVKTDSLVMCD